ncbi:hypothetical protein ABIA32_003688 [Streptacidiphilus sp. MAP12-20]
MKGSTTMGGEAFSLMAKEGGRVGSGALGAGRGAIGPCRPMGR